MRCTFRLDQNVIIMDVEHANGHAPPFGYACRIKGKRFDEFVTYESGEAALHAVLDGYRGIASRNVPIILNFGRGKTLCGYLTIEPDQQAAEPNKFLNCVLTSEK